MVRAILDGRKTETRRVVKPQFGKTWGWGVPSWRGFQCMDSKQPWKDAFAVHVDIPTPDGRWKWLFCPFGKAGDLLWMRCNYTVQYNESRDECHWRSERLWVTTHGRPFRKDGKPMKLGNKPSMHMPYWLSIEQWPLLQITDVRVERLQDISEEAAQAEGFEPSSGNPDRVVCGEAIGMNPTAREKFADIWNRLQLNRKDPGGLSWSDNPWVWVIQFKRLTDG